MSVSKKIKQQKIFKMTKKITESERENLLRLETDAKGLNGSYSAGYIAGLREGQRSLRIVESFYDIYFRVLESKMKESGVNLYEVKKEAMTELDSKTEIPT